jgi:hypothetical protein
VNLQKTPHEQLSDSLNERASLYRSCIVDYGLGKYNLNTIYSNEQQTFQGDVLMVCHSSAAQRLKKNNLYSTIIKISGDMVFDLKTKNEYDARLTSINCNFTLYSHTENGLLKTGSFYRSEESQKNLIFIIQQQNLFLMKKPEDQEIISLLS